MRGILLIQIIGAVLALLPANAVTPMDARRAGLTGDSNATAHNASNTPYFYCPYAGYDDWVIPVERKMTGQNQTTSNELNEANKVKEISLYSAAKRRIVKYDQLNTFWANRSANAYVVKKFNRHVNRPPIVRAVLKIFWTMDKSNIADSVRIIAARERDNERLPALPDFIDVSNMLSREDRWRVIQNTLQEAFDYWSTILYGRVVFEYVEYNARLKNSSYFNLVIMVSMKDMIHIDEHTNAVEGFSSKSTLAHASVNFLHFNRETTVFYIAPHLTSERVYIAVERKNSINNRRQVGLYEVSSQELAKRYRVKTYTYLYKQRQDFLRKLLYRNNTRLWCFLCVAMHEIGHVLGLGHTNQRQSMMYSYYRSDEVIYYKEDKRAIRKLYAGLINRIKTTEMNNLLAQCQQIRHPQVGKDSRFPSYFFVEEHK